MLVVIRTSNDFKEHSDKTRSFASLERKRNFSLSECRRGASLRVFEVTRAGPHFPPWQVMRGLPHQAGATLRPYPAPAMLAARMRRIERTGGRYLASIAAGMALWLAGWRHPVAQPARQTAKSGRHRRETAGVRKCRWNGHNIAYPGNPWRWQSELAF
jgi:hypothetical protein